MLTDCSGVPINNHKGLRCCFYVMTSLRRFCLIHPKGYNQFKTYLLVNILKFVHLQNYKDRIVFVCEYKTQNKTVMEKMFDTAFVPIQLFNWIHEDAITNFK